MSFIKKSVSALGKLISVIILGTAFSVGLAGVVYMSLQGNEVKVPEIVGKNFDESEKELENLGLRIKKRADRYSEEAPNTILEQLPRPGDTVKTGQLILVVTSKPNPEGEEKPATIQKGKQEDDSEAIEELITDKPKKKDSNSNTSNKKRTSVTRDTIKNSNTASNSANGNKNSSESNNNSNKNRNDSSLPNNKPTNPTGSPKPPPAKTPTGGDTRERRAPNN